jgi:quinol-cytochrome oxidoreductase complex cytochrome b subunit
MMVAVAIGYVLLAIFQLTDTQKRAPQLDLRHGWWVLVWFVGILVVSYLGSYSGVADKPDAGQAKVYGFNGGIIANIILTIIVLAVAWYCQLPGERVEQILAESESEEAAPTAI